MISYYLFYYIVEVSIQLFVHLPLCDSDPLVRLKDKDLLVGWCDVLG